MVKNNSQRHTEGTRTLSKITQVEIVNSLQQWFLFHEIIFFTLANYIQIIPQNYYKCKNVKNIHIYTNCCVSVWATLLLRNPVQMHDSYLCT